MTIRLILMMELVTGKTVNARTAKLYDGAVVSSGSLDGTYDRNDESSHDHPG